MAQSLKRRELGSGGNKIKKPPASSPTFSLQREHFTKPGTMTIRSSATATRIPMEEVATMDYWCRFCVCWGSSATPRIVRCGESFVYSSLTQNFQPHKDSSVFRLKKNANKDIPYWRSLQSSLQWCSQSLSQGDQKIATLLFYLSQNKVHTPHGLWRYVSRITPPGQWVI